MEQVKKLIPISAWPEEYPSQSSWRWMRFNAAYNGLDEAGVFVKIGRRVLINPEAFYRWAAENGGRPLSRVAPGEYDAD